MTRYVFLIILVLFVASTAVQAAPIIEIVDSVGNVGRYTSLKLDGAGNPVISYRDHGTGALKLAHCDDPNCSGGGESIVVVDAAPSVPGSIEASTSLELDGAGNPVISYFNWDTHTLNLAHCDDPNCAGGGESIEVIDAIPSAVMGMSNSLALDSGGNPAISYSYDDGVNPTELRLAHCDDPNCTGGGESIATVHAASGNVGLYPSLVLDGADNPVISYYAEGTPSINDLYMAHCNDPDCTGGGESIAAVDVPGDAGLFTSLVLDGAGRPVISYELDWPPGGLKVAHCNDPNCTGGGESIVTINNAHVGFIGGTTSLALDGAGNPVVSYWNDITAALIVLHCNDPNCAGGDESLVPVDGTLERVGAFNSLVLDGVGNPVISYYDETNGDLKLIHCDTPYCAPVLTIDDVTVNEDTGAATFTLSLGTTGNYDVVVSYRTANGSATAPGDYTATNTTATIAAGALGTTITIPIRDDLYQEPTDQFFVNITGATNAYIADNQGIGTITDTDVLPPPTPTPIPRSDSDANPVTVNDNDASPQIDVFDPAISKLGFLLPGEVGVTGEQLEWTVIVSNTGSAAGRNVVITDTLDSRLRIDKVDAPGATVNVTGQTVSVTYATLGVGQSVQFSIFTTVLEGAAVFNTACVNADNQAAPECATGSPVTQLPQTGETPRR